MTESTLNLWFAVGAVGAMAVFCGVSRLSPRWFPLLMLICAIPGIVQHRPERIWSTLLVTGGVMYVLWPQRSVAWMARQRNSARYVMMARFFDTVHGMLLYRIVGVVVIGMGVSWWFAPRGSFNADLTPPPAESYPVAYRRIYHDFLGRVDAVPKAHRTADMLRDRRDFNKMNSELAAAFRESAKEYQDLSTPDEFRSLQDATVGYYDCMSQKFDFYAAEEAHPTTDIRRRTNEWDEKAQRATNRMRDALREKAGDSQQFAEILRIKHWDAK